MAVSEDMPCVASMFSNSVLHKQQGRHKLDQTKVEISTTFISCCITDRHSGGCCCIQDSQSVKGQEEGSRGHRCYLRVSIGSSL